ncbi:MAG: hypothetical protein R3E44_02435 [Paracoccaceae bacterium]
MDRTTAYLPILVGFFAVCPPATSGQALRDTVWQDRQAASAVPPRDGPPIIAFGIGATDLPDVRYAAAVSGAGTATSGGRLFGPTLTLDYSRPLGPAGAPRPLRVTYSGALSTAGRSESSLERLGGGGLFGLTAGSAPRGRIDLATSANAVAATASGTAVVNGGGSITSLAYSPAGTGAAISQYAVSGMGGSRAFLALTTDGDARSAAGYAAIIDATGYTFLAAGDTTGTVVTDSVRDSFRAQSHAFRFSTDLDAGGGWTLSPGVGPMYRATRRSVERTTTIDIAETMPGAGIPALSFGQRGEIDTRYLGLIAGVGLSRDLPGDWSLLMDAELGLARYRGELTARSWATVGGSPNIHVVERPSAVSGLTQQGTLSLSISRPMARGVVSLGVYANYISDVPTFDYQSGGAPAVTAPYGAGSASFVGAGQSQMAPSLGTDGASSYGVNLSFNRSF